MITRFACEAFRRCLVGAWRQYRQRRAPVLAHGIAVVRPARLHDLSIDEGASKHTSSLVLIVRRAENSRIGRVTSTAKRTRLNVVDLEERARFATHAVVTDERALLSIALERSAAGGSRE